MSTVEVEVPFEDMLSRYDFGDKVRPEDMDGKSVKITVSVPADTGVSVVAALDLVTTDRYFTQIYRDLLEQGDASVIAHIESSPAIAELIGYEED